MSRAALLLSLTLTGCTAPALLDLVQGLDLDSTSTGDSSSGTSDSSGDASSTTSIMTTHGGSGSGAGTTTTGTPGETSTSTGTSTTTGDPASTGDGPPVCGDGVVEGDEECDDADDARCTECTRDRWVFASAATDHLGDLGGLDGADSLCRQYALQSGKADATWMTFIAWLSDSDHDVRDRLYPGRGRYLRSDGEVVVELVDEFYSGMLAAPINLDEHGMPAPGGATTGTLPDGTAAPGTHCENWTSGSILDFSSHHGSTGSTDVWWTMGQNPDANPGSCGTYGPRLYCIEGK